MLFTAISRWQSRLAAGDLHDHSSVARDFRHAAGAIGFGSERRAKLSGNRQSAFAGGLCKLIGAFQKCTSFAGRNHTSGSNKSFCGGHNRDHSRAPYSHDLDAGGYFTDGYADSEIKATSKTKAGLEE